MPARRPSRYRFKDGSLPSDFFRRNAFISFQEDAILVQNRQHVGIDNVVWGNDYPHRESTFPRSKEILDDRMAGVPDDERQKMTLFNVAELYGFELPI